MAPYVNLKTPNWNKCSVTKDLHVFLLVLASADCHGQFAVVGNWARLVCWMCRDTHWMCVVPRWLTHTQLPNHELEGQACLSLIHACAHRPACRGDICAHAWTDPPCLYLLEHMQAISKQHSASLSGRWQVEWRLIHHLCLCSHIGNTVKTVHLNETWSTLVSCLPLFWV